MKVLGSSQLYVVLGFFFCFGLTSSSSAAFAPSTSLKFQQQLASNENDDDYLSQKEHVLEKSYQGLIRENETLVEITPLIKVDEEKICDFRILKKPYHEIPFQIELVNNLGIIKARRKLNCEKRKSFHFEVVAIFCDGTHSATANVYIKVVDINEYAPTFLQPSYVTQVDEGRLYKEIIRVEARDKDCAHPFGDVCKYEILNSDQPFTIDNEGSIKNTEPLSHKASHNHILSVVAYDCAMKESEPIMVSIKVRRLCEARLLGVPERIDYSQTASTETLSLFPNARLELCEIYCNGENVNIHTSVALKTKYISFGCDREIANCTASTKLIDLLPRSAEWTKDLSYDEGFEPVFHFDGNSGVIVPDHVVHMQDFSTRPFSIVTVFRHFSLPTANKHSKEHIVCSADDHKMNRHHMALFVRNCRLILLLRKNFNEGDLNIFSPAEWRWKIPQVCDNEWHHYVLNIDLNAKVELYIDGVRFESSVEDHHSNPEVIDDWPLHAAHGINTTLSVGACYQSSEARLKHGFSGDISEIKIALDGVLSADDVKCGTNCAEHLLPPPEHLLEADSQVQINSQLNEIYIEGQSKENIEQLLQHVQYMNTKKNPTIGRRNIEVRTTLMCINQSTVRLPTVETYIMVNEPSSLSKSKSNDYYTKINTATMSAITSDSLNTSDNVQSADNTEVNIVITGNNNNLVSYPEIKLGVHIMGNINISVLAGGELVPNLQSLDLCSVTVFPSLNPDHEDIQVDGDGSLSSTLDIKTNINKDGVEMIGYDSITNYLDVLRALVYSNKKPAYYLNRVFKLSCSQLNSQFKSAEFTLTLTVLHPKQTMAPSTSAPPSAVSMLQYGASPVFSNALQPHEMQQSPQQSAQQHLDGRQPQYDGGIYANTMMHSHEVQEPKSRLHSIVRKAESSHPTMLIILICVLFVVLLCGVSIARLRNSNKYADREQPCQKIADESLVWDDSALTITINPMQTDAASEDSSDSDNSESDEEEVANGHYANMNQLEWDNSNIFNSTCSTIN